MNECGTPEGWLLLSFWLSMLIAAFMLGVLTHMAIYGVCAL